MKKIKLYIAMTIDGFIARTDGALDWLDAVAQQEANADYGYHDFYASVDTVVMGRKTYEAILGFDVDWPYMECHTYVVTSQPNFICTTPKSHLIHENIGAQLTSLTKEEGKDIWLVGGGLLVSSLLDMGLVDEMYLSVVPVVLGNGIRLFTGNQLETSFTLVKSTPFSSGIINLIYHKK